MHLVTTSGLCPHHPATQNEESVTATQLRADGGINAAKIIVFGQTGSGSDGTASLWAREPVEVEGEEDDED